MFSKHISISTKETWHEINTSDLKSLAKTPFNQIYNDSYIEIINRNDIV